MHVGALAVGFAADALVGDPHGFPHPVRWMGKLIDGLEGPLRRAFPKTPAGEHAAGAALVVIVVAVCGGVCAALAWACLAVNVWLAFAFEALVSYWMLAARSLRDETMKVRQALETGTLDDARAAVSMVVGRDVARLDDAGVTRAAVETVAENASDGVVAPLVYLSLFGPVGGVVYKAVNTMDSMVGYKNDRYRHFGTAAARTDDVVNFVPARLTGVLMCACARLVGLDTKGAWRVFKRDRKKHASPNSAHGEAACAGALGVRLAGPAWYFGKLVDKPYLGDDLRPIEHEDIRRANALMYAAAVAALVLGLCVGGALWAVCGVAV